MYDFTFCAIDLNITSDDIQRMLEEVLLIDDFHWYHDKLRGGQILPLYNGGGTTGMPPPGVSRSSGNMEWTSAGLECPYLCKLIKNKVFPFMNPTGRMSVLKTQSNKGLNLHIDSKISSIGTRQHKFRIVLNGDISKLYFMDHNMNKVYIPEYYSTYVIDGTHLHSIDPSPHEKITICIGTPWHGEENLNYEKLIQYSPYRMKVSRPEIKDEWECK